MCLLIIAICSCSQQYKDREIKKDLTSKAKSNKELIGVHFVVNDGIVSLSGECATPQDRAKVESTVKGVYAVTGVLDNIAIAPVVIGTDNLLKQSVDSTLKTYPGVRALVKDSIVQLQGYAETKDEQKLSTSIQELGPKQLQNQVVFR